jgi:hypothetical protein
MDYPEGFKDLVSAVHKSPLAPKKDLWEEFCRVVLIGKGRSDAEITFLLQIMKKQLDYEHILKTEGEDLEEELKKFLEERISRTKDDTIYEIFSDMLKNSFYLTASLKGGARLFERKKLPADLDKITKTKEDTKELINEIADDGDVTGIKYTKVILWLQAVGKAEDIAPPTRQLKSFLNTDIGPYYSYYEDDEYFMNRAEEMTKDFKVTLVEIYRAIYLYKTFKTVLPRGSKFTPKKLMSFMKKKKFTVKKLFASLSDMDKRDKVAKELYKFMGYSV